jgi:DNA-binding FrmR family transcriptional regulator
LGLEGGKANQSARKSPCLDLAQQVHAVENALGNAKRELIQDHMEHCLGDGIGGGEMNARTALREFKALAKYL